MVFECPSLRGKRTDKWDWSNFHKTTIRRESNGKKNKDFLAVEIPSEIKKNKFTKRTNLQKQTPIYDILGIISPSTIIGKIIYSDICGSKFHGATFCQNILWKKWEKWEKKQLTKVNIPRAISLGQDVLDMINIQVFGDTS